MKSRNKKLKTKLTGLGTSRFEKLNICNGARKNTIGTRTNKDNRILKIRLIPSRLMIVLFRLLTIFLSFNVSLSNKKKTNTPAKGDRKAISSKFIMSATRLTYQMLEILLYSHQVSLTASHTSYVSRKHSDFIEVVWDLTVTP